jgi:ribonuclease HI
VNWDATVGKNFGRLGLGAVIRDHNGFMCASKSLTRPGMLDPTAAKALAAIMAISLYNELGIRQVLLEGDARNVVEAVNN